MKSYLDKVNTGELPMNHEITYQLQDIFNLLPDVTNPCFVRSLQANRIFLIFTLTLFHPGLAKNCQ